MPLEIAYRPVVLDFGEPGSGEAGIGDAAMAFATAAQNQAEPRARDFVARIRSRDIVSLRGALYRPVRLRQRIAGIVLIALLPALLAVLGWGDPHGIRGAAAQNQGISGKMATRPVRAAILPWAPMQPLVHADGEIAPLALVGPSARPLQSAGTGLDRWRALQCLTTAIYYEAAREPDEGQRAVAQVVLNRVAHAAFPKTVCGVVFQGSERPGCQFSFACDGSLAHRPMAQWWDRARRVAETALAGNVYAPVGLATFYHTSAVHPAWDDSMAFLGTIGAHRFYRWNGSAGQPRAFAAVYLGGEPIAAPHPQTYTTTDADMADPLVLEKAFEAGRLAALRETPLADPATPRPAAFGQQPLPSAAPTTKPTTAPEPASARIMPGSGAVRPEAEPQYDGAAHWIHQPGT